MTLKTSIELTSGKIPDSVDSIEPEPKVLKVFVLEDDGGRGLFFMRSLPNHSLIICNNAQEAVTILSNITFDVIFLDHDLGGQAYVDSSEPNTGMYVAKRIPVINETTPIVIHSWNIMAAKNMEALLRRNHKAQVVQTIFSSKEFVDVYTQIFGDFGTHEQTTENQERPVEG